MQYLVQADNAAQMKATLTRHDTGVVIDLTGSTILLKVRKRGTTTVLFNIAALEATAGDYLNGIATFPFNANLDTLEGFYEGEIEITYPSTQVETVFEVIHFQIRRGF